MRITETEEFTLSVAAVRGKKRNIITQLPGTADDTVAELVLEFVGCIFGDHANGFPRVKQHTDALKKLR